MAKKKNTGPRAIRNRRVSYDYELGDSLVAGVVLSGGETKALRMGHGHLRGSYVTVKDGELWLLNATITGTNNIHIDEHDQTRSRKLLANKKQIAALIDAKNQGKTIVPTDVLISGRYIKVRIAVGTGKKHYDKRENLKRKGTLREMDRAIKRT